MLFLADLHLEILKFVFLASVGSSQASKVCKFREIHKIYKHFKTGRDSGFCLGRLTKRTRPLGAELVLFRKYIAFRRNQNIIYVFGGRF